MQPAIQSAAGPWPAHAYLVRALSSFLYQLKAPSPGLIEWLSRGQNRSNDKDQECPIHLSRSVGSLERRRGRLLERGPRLTQAGFQLTCLPPRPHQRGPYMQEKGSKTLFHPFPPIDTHHRTHKSPIHQAGKGAMAAPRPPPPNRRRPRPIPGLRTFRLQMPRRGPRAPPPVVQSQPALGGTQHVRRGSREFVVRDEVPHHFVSVIKYPPPR